MAQPQAPVINLTLGQVWKYIANAIRYAISAAVLLAVAATLLKFFQIPVPIDTQSPDLTGFAAFIAATTYWLKNG